MGVQFDRLRNMRQGHVGQFWGLVKHDLPTTEDHPPLDEIADVVGDPPSLKIELSSSPPMYRSWFLSEDGHRLLQLQPDRLVYNWRGEGADYPRYAEVERRFFEYWTRFEAFCAESALGNLRPNCLELTYVNRVEGVANLSDVLIGFTPPAPTNEFVASPPADVRLGARFDVEAAGQRAGVLFLDAGALAGPTPALGLTLTFRSGVSADTAASPQGLADRLEVGHKTIVLSFDDMCSEYLKTTWGRRI